VEKTGERRRGADEGFNLATGKKNAASLGGGENIREKLHLWMPIRAYEKVGSGPQKNEEHRRRGRA